MCEHSLVDDRDWMAIALAEARRAAAEDEVPIGAVVVLDGHELARAHNQPILRRDPSAHAEILALRAAGERAGAYRLPGAVLFATVEPCAMCLGAALHARVARIVYGAADPKGGAAASLYRIFEDRRLNHMVAVTGGILQEECSEILSGFFQEKRLVGGATSLGLYE